MIAVDKLDLANRSDREIILTLLAKLIDKISQHGLSLPHAPAPAYAPLTGTVYGRSGTEWPKPGEDFPPIAEGIFETEAYRNRYQPGVTVKVYAAGCPGLRTLANLVDLPLRKFGATLSADVRVRIQYNSINNYAGFVKIGDEHQLEDGFDKYVATPIFCTKTPARYSPVSVEPRSLSVILPQGMSFDDFELALQKALRPASLLHWIATPEGAAHFERLRLLPTIAQRFTRYSDDLVEAMEIYIARPRNDGDRLVRVLEYIVLKNMGILR